MRKIKSEAGLNVKITPNDQLFTMDIIHKKNATGIYAPDYSVSDDIDCYHTPAVCYIARVPPYSNVKNLIVAGDGNTSFKLFTKIDENMDSYIKRAMSEAWKKCGYA